MIVAVTGATGFLGSRLIPALLNEGHEVRALTRRPQSQNAQNLTWIGGDLHTTDRLNDLASGADAVIHAAASLRGRTAEHFDRPNRQGTASVLSAAQHKGVPFFLHISSLAARAPELSHYSASKRAAEDVVTTVDDIGWTILRPPAVYGPGDPATLPVFKAVRRGFAPRIGGGPRPFSLIHVDDLISAILFLLKAEGLRGSLVHVDDGRPGGYTFDDLFSVIGAAMGKKPLPVAMPVYLMRLVAEINGLMSSLTGRAPMLTREKLRELTAPDWVAGEPLLTSLSDWRPQIGVETGMQQTVQWYREHGWL